MTLSERLRAETRAAHDAIEAAFGLDSWLASPAAYAALLGRMHAFHAAIEPAAAQHLAGTPLAVGTGRAPRLAADLAALGQADSAPVLADIALPRDRAEAIGAVYVLEGSALGGLLIAKQVADRLGIGAEDGASFFAGEGRDTMRHWRAMQAGIDALASPAGDDRTVAFANRAFASMQAAIAAPVAGGPG